MDANKTLDASGTRLFKLGAQSTDEVDKMAAMHRTPRVQRPGTLRHGTPDCTTTKAENNSA